MESTAAWRTQLLQARAAAPTGRNEIMKNTKFVTLTAVALLCLLPHAPAEAQKKKASAASEATAHNEAGIKLLQTNANAEAVEEFTKAIEASPKDFRIYNNRAKAYRAAQKFPESVADFTKAIE